MLFWIDVLASHHLPYPDVYTTCQQQPISASVHENLSTSPARPHLPVCGSMSTAVRYQNPTVVHTSVANIHVFAGQPKAIPWTHTTPIRCAANAFFHQDVRQGDTVAWPTNLGWMMGPWLVFAALLNGAPIAPFQGSPLGRGFGEFVQSAGVSMLGLVPSIAKAWRASDCMKVVDCCSGKMPTSS